jgi:hypothetical protein
MVGWPDPGVITTALPSPELLDAAGIDLVLVPPLGGIVEDVMAMFPSAGRSTPIATETRPAIELADLAWSYATELERARPTCASKPGGAGTMELGAALPQL